MEKRISKLTAWTNKHPALNESWHILWVMVGGVLVALGLEAFLIPMGFLDGGVTGISIILAKFFPIPMGVFLGILNIPFIILAWRKLGRRSAIRTTIGVITLAVSTILLHHIDPWTDNYVLALFYGGTLIGFGIGIALRNGGALDGTETLATVISNKSSYSVDQIILYINICIFIVAGFVMGWEQAMSSALLFYIVVANLINKVVTGSSEMKSVVVTTDEPKKLAALLNKLTHRTITIHARKEFDVATDDFVEANHDLKFNISRLEEAEITESILQVDPDAIIRFKDIASLRGGIYENNGHH